MVGAVTAGHRSPAGRRAFGGRHPVIGRRVSGLPYEMVGVAARDGDGTRWRARWAHNEVEPTRR
ncbi:hypothetical protein [Nonomuraea dietziae]|uniref:hypothetical protein n=1 Tax=Nonomuraea dietziae TaxID=65515 RepID=UPI0031D7AD48